MQRPSILVVLGLALIGGGTVAAVTGRPKQRRPPELGLTARTNDQQLARAQAPYLKGAGPPKLPARALSPTTRIEVIPGSIGDDLVVQQEFARLMSKRDPVPDGRIMQFLPCLDEPTIRVTGWDGLIEEVVPGRGGLLVTVTISPRLESDSGNSVTYLNSYQEIYLYSDGVLKFLEGSSSLDPTSNSMIID